MRLSASRIETYQRCSYLYYNKYTLKLPDEASAAMAKGSMMHCVLEYLLRKDRKPLVEIILKANDVCAAPSVSRLIRALARKYRVNENGVKTIKEFILRGLKLDFYHEGCSFLEAEHHFVIEGNGWSATGKIDKIAEYENKVIITDYKSSASKHDKESLQFNLQNYFYTYVAKKLFPGKEIIMQFQFLKMPKAPIQVAPALSEDELRGFVDWLPHISEFLENFTLEQAMETPAKLDISKINKCCGKRMGTIKENGEEAFNCSFRYPFIYFELWEGGKMIKTSRKRSELGSGKIVEKVYEGCPFFKHEYQ